MTTQQDFIMSKFNEQAEIILSAEEAALFLEDYDKYKAELIRQRLKIEITIEEITTIICQYFNSSLAEVRGKCRKREFVIVRHWIHYYAKRMTKLTLQQIADYTYKNHATVLNSIVKINGYLETDKQAVKVYNELETLLSDFKKSKPILIPIVKRECAVPKIPRNPELVNRSMYIAPKFQCDSHFAKHAVL
jgi:chromosomal replication initiation ATPase DnaA